MIHRSLFLKYCALPICLLAVFTMPTLVLASESPRETITLRPATVSLTVNAGEVILQTLYFTNSTGERRTFVVDRSDYVFDAANSKTINFVASGSTKDSVQSMLDVTPMKFDLDSGKTQELLVRIRPSISTSTGQYKGVLFIGPQQVTNSTVSIELAGRVGSIIGVTVAQGGLASGGFVGSFSARPSAGFVALLLILALAFISAAVAASRKARIQKKEMYL